MNVAELFDKVMEHIENMSDEDVLRCIQEAKRQTQDSYILDNDIYEELSRGGA